MSVYAPVLLKSLLRQELVTYGPSTVKNRLLPTASLVILPPDHSVRMGFDSSWSDVILGVVIF